MNVKLWLLNRNKIARTDAELMLCEVLGCSRAELILKENLELSDTQVAKLDDMYERRVTGEPLAYILGRKEFYGCEFEVNDAVLIPRPETEDVIELIDKNSKVILDVGTGSGCIAITCALEMSEAKVYALDISKRALTVAQKNAKRLGAKVEFIESDLLLNYHGPEPDTIIANLPYVDRNWEWASPELRFEPETALYAEDGGLYEIKRLLKQIDERYKNMSVFLEADTSQHEAIMTLDPNSSWKSSGFWCYKLRA